MAKHISISWTHAQGVGLKSAVAYYNLMEELKGCGCQYLVEVMDDTECTRAELEEIILADEYWSSYE